MAEKLRGTVMVCSNIVPSSFVSLEGVIFSGIQSLAFDTTKTGRSVLGARYLTRTDTQSEDWFGARDAIFGYFEMGPNLIKDDGLVRFAGKEIGV
jgi:hypothetical protein